MTLRLSDAGIRVVLLDIEGTTTPIEFVHEVLFPYARARMRDYLEEIGSDGELQDILANLRKDNGQLPLAGHDQLEADVALIHALMDLDRKSGPLKTLQGKIWERGYASGQLEGEVYPDVPIALAQWAAAGIGVGIFSSGSVLAQKLLFKHSTAGDLTPFLRWHFDTAVGAKAEPASYRRILEQVNTQASDVLFISDVAGELDAARASGVQTLLCVRPPSAPPDSSTHPVVQSFASILP